MTYALLLQIKSLALSPHSSCLCRLEQRAHSRSIPAVVGPVVNLSARLMVAAGKLPSTNGNVPRPAILCDEQTWKLARGGFEWETLPPIRVKGKTDAVPVYALSLDARVGALLTLLSRHVPLARIAKVQVFHSDAARAVGREAELVAMRKEAHSVKEHGTVPNCITCSLHSPVVAKAKPVSF